MRGDVRYICARCGEQFTAATVADLGWAMRELAAIGRHDMLWRRMDHACPDGGYGFAEACEGVPTPPESPAGDSESPEAG